MTDSNASDGVVVNPGARVSKWADDFMFKAEPLKASDGPQVYLLAGTPDPLGAISAMAKMYKGQVVRNIALDVTDEERRDYMREILKTKLKAPMEAVKMHFMIEGVTRSYTHQMVRQRTAVYAQESLRFAVKEDMATGVAYPPSILSAKDDDPQRVIWDDAVNAVSAAYLALIESGMPAEDARGLLPHNITTRLNYVTDLRALQDHGGNRLCTQAQYEWRIVWVRIIAALRAYCTCQMSADGEVFHGDHCDNWQWGAIADIFRPVCYLTGKCEFMADFDRKCSIRDRVEANHHVGRPSIEWDQEAVADIGGRVQTIQAIHPAEWLLDAGAAR